jgi:hypothetical protein
MRDLADLYGYQASPSGMVVAHVVALVWTVGELQRLTADPATLRVLAPERADLEWVQVEIGQLLCRLRAVHEMAA